MDEIKFNATDAVEMAAGLAFGHGAYKAIDMAFKSACPPVAGVNGVWIRLGEIAVATAVQSLAAQYTKEKMELAKNIVGFIAKKKSKEEPEKTEE